MLTGEGRAERQIDRVEPIGRDNLLERLLGGGKADTGLVSGLPERLGVE